MVATATDRDSSQRADASLDGQADHTDRQGRHSTPASTERNRTVAPVTTESKSRAAPPSSRSLISRPRHLARCWVSQRTSPALSRPLGTGTIAGLADL